MTEDGTLGGYLRVHQRPPAFTAPDGQAYSVATYVDETPDADGRFGGALLFIRWSSAGDRPVGHVETPDLVFGPTRDEAAGLLEELTLHQLKAALDRAVASTEEHRT